MLAPDIPVWWRFLETWGHEVEGLWYDCLLGGPFLSKAEEQDPLKKSWRYVNSKRPDAVIETKDEVWVIEVSANPGLRALGQCMAYLALWIEDPVILKPEKAVLIVETLDTDVGASCGHFGIRVFVV